MIRKALLWLLVVLASAAFVVVLVYLYLVRWSPDRGYYRVKFGLASAKPFRIHGKVVDQYGEPVKCYEMALRTFFEEHAASVAHSKIGPFIALTDEDGKFCFDTSPIGLNGVFYGSKEQDSYQGGVYYHVRGYSGEDIFTLYRSQWMRDARLCSPTPLPHDESKEYIYHVNRSGPPERMIQFHEPYPWPTIPKPSDAWFSVNVLAGKVLPGRDPEADVLIHLKDFDRSCMSWGDCIPMRPFRVELYGGKGAKVQFAKDQSSCEAPPDGYEPMVAVEPQLWEGTPAPPPVPFPWWYFPYIQGDRLGSKKWVAAGTGSVYPPWNIYFQSGDKQVYGALTVHPEWTESNPQQSSTMNRPDLLLKIFCVANPRGERNLNFRGLGGERAPIPLPVILPFKEDIPVVDPMKIWAYEKPQNENTLIVEGEKGAVEPGAGFTVLNRGIRRTDYTHVGSDGSFKVVLEGEEGDPLGIHIGWPGGVSPKTGKKVAQDEGVVIAPRWRLAQRQP